MPDQTAPAPTAEDQQTRRMATARVLLEEPIEREGGRIEALTLRKPRAGELRGLKVGDLATGDIAAVIDVLPRISDPFITQAEAADLSMPDISEIAGTIMGFFMTQDQMAYAREMLGLSPSIS